IHGIGKPNPRFYVALPPKGYSDGKQLREHWSKFLLPLERGTDMSKPTIYVFAPDLSHPLAGMRMLYRHVDILNANGFEAFIVHASANFKIDWFEYQTPVLRGPVKMKSDDIAVFSEIGGLKINEWTAGKRKVIFNQNA